MAYGKSRTTGHSISRSDPVKKTGRYTVADSIIEEIKALSARKDVSIVGYHFQHGYVWTHCPADGLYRRVGFTQPKPDKIAEEEFQRSADSDAERLTCFSAKYWDGSTLHFESPRPGAVRMWSVNERNQRGVSRHEVGMDKPERVTSSQLKEVLRGQARG